MNKSERYQNGKVYKLVNDIDDDIYVGSTCLVLPKRKYQHNAILKLYPNRKVYAHLNKIGWENVHIILIESYPCSNKMELLKRERYHVDLLKPSLNTCVPSRSKKEYCQDKPELGRGYQTKWYASNTNNVSEKAKEKMECSTCNCMVRKWDISRHNKTQKHLNALQTSQTAEQCRKPPQQV